MVKHRSSRTDKPSRASLILLIALAFLLLLGTVVLVTRLPEDEAWQWAGSTSADQDSQMSGFTCSAAEAQTLYPFLDGVIRLTPERVTYLDILGSERYAIDTDFTAPFLIQQGRWLLVADREGTGYLMLSEQGEQYRGRLEGRVGGAAINENGMVALIQDRQDNTGIVTVLEAETGRSLYDCHFPESGYVLSLAFTPDGSYFDVNLINTDGSTAQTILKRYSIDGTQQGQRLPDLPGLQPLLLHNGDGDPVVCGFNSITALSYSTDQPLWQQTYARIHAVTSDARGVWTLSQKNSQGMIGLYRIDMNGAEKQWREIGENTVEPLLSSDYIAIGNGARLILLSSRDGKEIKTETLNAEIIRMGFSGQDSLLIVTAGGVSRLPLGT